MTRRQALRLTACAASHSLRAAAPEIRIEPHGDGTAPSAGVFLAGRTDPVAVIEMPEHAWHKKTNADQPEWFFRMYTNDAQVKGRPAWTREGNVLRYTMPTPSGIALNATAALQPDGVLIRYAITNPESSSYAEVQAVTCIKLYRPFTDVFLERTYVHHPEGLDLLASETPERLSKNAEEWLPCRYIVRCSPDAAPPAQRVEREDGITRYRKLRAADTPFIATESNPSGWIAATHSLSSPDVWTNPARTCQHADAGTSLDANSTARIALKFYLMRGRVQDVWKHVAERHRQGQL